MKNKSTLEEIEAQRLIWTSRANTTNFMPLYRAMLLNAIEGCLCNYVITKSITNDMEYYKKIRLQKAQMEHEWDREYIKSNSTDLFSFISLCNYCDVDYDILRQKVNNLIDHVEENKYTRQKMNTLIFVKPVEEYLLSDEL